MKAYICKKKIKKKIKKIKSHEYNYLKSRLPIKIIDNSMKIQIFTVFFFKLINKLYQVFYLHNV